MHRILCSSGSLMENQEQIGFDFLIKGKEMLRFDGFELLFCRNWYPHGRELIHVIRENDLFVPVFHCEKHIMQTVFQDHPLRQERTLDLFKRNCEIAAEIQAKMLVLHLWNGKESDFFIEEQIKLLPQLISLSKERELLLTIENVACSKSDPLSRMMEIKKDFPQIAFTIDTRMAAFHGQLDQMCQKNNRFLWEDNVKHVHLCDYKGGVKEWKKLFPTPLGKGQIDFEHFFEYLTQVNYEGDFTVESIAHLHDGTVDYKELNRMHEYVRDSLSHEGKGGLQ